MFANKTKRSKSINRYTRNKKRTLKKKIIVGQIFADWCGHCKMLKPEWNKMKTMLKNNVGRTLHNVEFTFVELGDTEENKQKNISIDDLLSNFNRKIFPTQNKQVTSDGFPTIFKICRKRIEYYNGPRLAEDMYNWFIQKC